MGKLNGIDWETMKNFLQYSRSGTCNIFNILHLDTCFRLQHKVRQDPLHMLFSIQKFTQMSKLFFLFQAGSTERKRTSGSPTMVPGLRGHGLQVIMIMVSR